MKSLLEIIREKGGSVRVRDLYRGFPSRWKQRKDAEAALQSLVDDGYGEWMKVRQDSFGPTTKEFVLRPGANPRIGAEVPQSPWQCREREDIVKSVEKRGGRITPRELYNNSKSRYGSSAGAAGQLQSLVDAGLGRWEEIATTTRGGRPSREFVLNGYCPSPEPDRHQRDVSQQSNGALIGSLKKQVEMLERSLEASRRSRYQLPIASKRKDDKGAIVRVIIPDTHGAKIDPGACKAFLSDLEILNPSEVVMLGDHLDCGGWLAQHHALGFVPETDDSFEDDLAAANQFLDAVHAAAPGSKKWYLAGNHEARIEKAILKWTLGAPSDSRWMLSRLAPQYIMHLEDRGVTWVARDVCQPGMIRPGVLKLGKCYFTHGVNCGATATQKTLTQFKANVCFGHTHRIAVATQESAEEPTLAAWSFGCLCKRVPLYLDTKPSDWSHGYGIQVVEPDGQFLTLQIPIVNGRSLLSPLASKLRAA